MNQQDPLISRADWSLKLVTYYFIDLGMLARAMQAGLPKLKNVLSADELIAPLTADFLLHPERAGGWYCTVDGRHFLGVHLFVRRYSSWIKTIGAALGFAVDSMLMEDDWLTDDMPELQAVIWGLMDRVRQDLTTARAMTDPTAVAEAFRIVRRSIASGEHPHQTKARADRVTHGLRLVH